MATDREMVTANMTLAKGSWWTQAPSSAGPKALVGRPGEATRPQNLPSGPSDLGGQQHEA